MESNLDPEYPDILVKCSNRYFEELLIYKKMTWTKTHWASIGKSYIRDTSVPFNNGD